MRSSRWNLHRPHLCQPLRLHPRGHRREAMESMVQEAVLRLAARLHMPELFQAETATAEIARARAKTAARLRRSHEAICPLRHRSMATEEPIHGASRSMSTRWTATWPWLRRSSTMERLAYAFTQPLKVKRLTSWRRSLLGPLALQTAGRCSFEC